MRGSVYHNEVIFQAQMVRLDILAHRWLDEEELARIGRMFRQTKMWQKLAAGLGERRMNCDWATVRIKSPFGLDAAFGTTIKVDHTRTPRTRAIPPESGERHGVRRKHSTTSPT